ncbi:MAG: phosphonate ABC transporter substrate-binidng protein [Candidatus Cloacimonetes bacterium 4572_65]|nr:MAG: phosphonate ABC transporter substrate-binidng protein [Candidatus Cloacimonetes bacterium 4572_65]
MKRATILLVITLLLVTLGCEKAPLGTKKNPVKMYFVPSLEHNKLISSGEIIEHELERISGLEIETSVPTSYAAVIEAMGVGRADIAWLPTFSYYLANKKYGAKATFQTVRSGLSEYKGQFIARADSDIKSLEDIAGKTIAYSDASSTSGFIFPSALLAFKNIEPATKMFVGGHDTVVRAVLQGKADVGCTYWSPAENGEPQDARMKLLTEDPDIYEKVKIVGFTDWIPNDNCTFRGDLPEDIANIMIKAITEFKDTPEGKKAFKELYEIDDLKRVDDSAYDVVRKRLNMIDINKLK